MPRRPALREYYDAESYEEVERDRPRRPTRRNRVNVDDESDPYYRSRVSMPPVEELENIPRDRLHYRGRGPSDLREEFVPSRKSGRGRGRGREAVDIIPPPPPPAPPAPPSPPAAPPERSRDEFLTRQRKPHRRRRAEREELDFEDDKLGVSDEDDIIPARRSERIVPVPPPPPPPPPPDEVDTEEEIARRERRRRKGRVPVEHPPLPPPPDEHDGYEEIARHGQRRRKGRMPVDPVPPPPPPPPPPDEHDGYEEIARHGRRRRKGRVPVDPVPPPPPPPPPPDENDTEEEIARHERRRKGRMPVEPEYERSEVQTLYPHRPNMGRHRGKGREDILYPLDLPVQPWSRGRNNSDSESEESEESLDSSDDSDDDDEDEDRELILRKNERGRRHGKDDSEEDMTIKNRTDDSSPESSSSRDPSPDLLTPPPRHHRRRPKYPDTEPDYEMVQPPVAPSPDLLPPRRDFDELGRRCRGKKGKPSHGDVLLERGKPSPMQHLPPSKPKSSRRRKKEEMQVVHSRPQSGDFGKDPSTRGHNRQIKDSRDRQEELELELYNYRKSEQPFANGKGGAGDVSIIDPAPMVPAEDIRLRHRGDRKSRYFPEDEESSEEETEDNKVGRRYIGTKNRRDRLWTEITKDLVVKEAIEGLGYEYEETEFFYYVFSYLHYDDVSALVQLSEDIRQARRRRVHEINRERASGFLPPQPPQVPQLPPAPSGPPVFDKFAAPMLERPWPGPGPGPWEGHRMSEQAYGSRWPPPQPRGWPPPAPSRRGY